MTGKRIGYVRVSTLEQNPGRQLEGVALDKKFVDYASGTTIKRPNLEALIDYVRDDDSVFVHSMDRLARNVKDLLGLVELFAKKGVEVTFLKENLSFKGQECHLSKLILMIIGSVAEFEHSLIMERQKEGIALAKKAGRYKGRKKKLNAEKIEILKNDLITRKPISQISKDLGISRQTLYKYMSKIGE